MLNFSSSAFVLASRTCCDLKEKDARAGTLFIKLSRAESLPSELVRDRLLISPREFERCLPEGLLKFSGNEYASDCILE